MPLRYYKDNVFQMFTKKVVICFIPTLQWISLKKNYKNNVFQLIFIKKVVKCTWLVILIPTLQWK